MNSYFGRSFVGIFVFLLVGCSQLAARISEEPPLPTIVPAEPTATIVVEESADNPTATPTDLILPTPTQQSQHSQSDVIETQPEPEAHGHN